MGALCKKWRIEINKVDGFIRDLRYQRQTVAKKNGCFMVLGHFRSPVALEYEANQLLSVP